MKRFFQSETAGGILLIGATVLAMLMANSPLASWYAMFLDMPVVWQIGSFAIDKPLLLWINDGLMALFFFTVGLELKEEWLQGDLSTPAQRLLPAIAAVGGMVAPAAMYLAMNYDDPLAVSGWAIPAATDIAFALAVLSLLGSNVPRGLKIFLASLAIFDDIGAIVIIAVFYTAHISLIALFIAISCLLGLLLLRYLKVYAKSAYIIIGIIMWASLLKSGVHATLAGVLLAMFIPLAPPHGQHTSMLHTMKKDLHGTVTFFVLPLFAFANTGLSFSGMRLEQWLHPVPVGIALSLFFGKQLGIFGSCWLAIRLKLCSAPAGSSWLTLYGISVLCGIGFTMSLFIGSLAFEASGVNMLFDERLGILAGSLLSATLGYLVLRYSLTGDQGK